VQSGDAMTNIGQCAARLIAAYDHVETLDPFTRQDPQFTMADGYAVLHEIEEHRRASGWQSVGRKIGFTNRTLWARYDIDRPLVASVWDRTLVLSGGAEVTVPLAPFCQPRIEPEVVFRLRTPVPVTDDPGRVLECVEWVAAGFEIVQSHYPGWRFKAPDCAAGFGLHGALVVGEPVPIDARDGLDTVRLFETFTLTLARDGIVQQTGRGDVVLGSPLLALAQVARLLAQMPQFSPLAAGEIVTTGTLTDALPVGAGERWEADYGALGVRGVPVCFT
jgi:2-oxo-3-hexenedioate decarboxylase